MKKQSLPKSILTSARAVEQNIVLSEIIKWVYVTICALATSSFLYAYVTFLALGAPVDDEDVNLAIEADTIVGDTSYKTFEVLDETDLMD